MSTRFRLAASRHRTAAALSVALVVAAISWSVSAATPTVKPEDAGFSSDRLRRVAEVMQRHIEAKNFSGAVTLVARNGRIVHHEAHGLMDLEGKKPMQKDAIFRIMSMTKPIVGVAILMMIEEGKVKLTDPVSRFIPEFREQSVGVAVPSRPAHVRWRRGSRARAVPLRQAARAVPADAAGRRRLNRASTPCRRIGRLRFATC